MPAVAQQSPAGPLVPADHWARLAPFVAGDARDPRDLFGLASDTWDAWRYRGEGAVVDATGYRFRFGTLGTPLRWYAKWYAYNRLLLAKDRLGASDALLPVRLAGADRWLVSAGVDDLSRLADPRLFDEMWTAMLGQWDGDPGARPRRTVLAQESTRPFWLALRAEFGFPSSVPLVAPHARPLPGAAPDPAAVIPPAVIRQLVNHLALHRDGITLLAPYDHLRLCVVVLTCVLGRRISEILGALRGSGRLGPLHLRPSGSGEALWFRFQPSKDGPGDEVLAASEWASITRYCVESLAASGDAVRALAPAALQPLLILVSPANGTAGPAARRWRPGSAARPTAGGLSYQALHAWLTDSPGPRGLVPGAVRRLNITVDGSPDAPLYRLRLHAARHTRQSVLASDPRVPLRARQRDLNHRSADAAAIYAHVTDDGNRALVARASRELIGPGIEWLAEVRGRGFAPGVPALVREDPRLARLLVANPAFVALNHVPLGYCSLPQGPGACEAFLLCAEAREGGCGWLSVPHDDPVVLHRLADRVTERRAAAARAGAEQRTVAAQREQVLAERAAGVLDGALSEASVELRERIRRRLASGAGDG